MRGAITIRSYASCAFSAKSCMTPESRTSIESEWSQWMLIGPESARLPDGHHDRRAHRRGDVDDLGHQREAL